MAYANDLPVRNLSAECVHIFRQPLPVRSARYADKDLRAGYIFNLIFNARGTESLWVKFMSERYHGRGLPVNFPTDGPSETSGEIYNLRLSRNEMFLEEKLISSKDLYQWAKQNTTTGKPPIMKLVVDDESSYESLFNVYKLVKRPALDKMDEGEEFNQPTILLVNLQVGKRI